MFIICLLIVLIQWQSDKKTRNPEAEKDSFIYFVGKPILSLIIWKPMIFSTYSRSQRGICN